MILTKLKGYLLMAGAFIAALAVAWFKGRSSGAEAAKTRLQQDIDQARREVAKAKARQVAAEAQQGAAADRNQVVREVEAEPNARKKLADRWGR